MKDKLIDKITIEHVSRNDGNFYYVWHGGKCSSPLVQCELLRLLYELTDDGWNRADCWMHPTTLEEMAEFDERNKTNKK